MNWEPQEKTGYTLLHAQMGERLYAIQKKDGIGGWRLFYRGSESEVLRTIFIGGSMTDCFVYADSYEAGIQ
ncbi:MAG: hypothetical protein A4E20_10770 [Nitrospira sp. SG-bin2]|nr:MAG: hypothetical protein A4E20_10770 [Nitrospira sp. SG-bin2]